MVKQLPKIFQFADRFLPNAFFYDAVKSTLFHFAPPSLQPLLTPQTLRQPP